MGAVEWGAWKDANSSVNKYWYWGFLRKYIYFHLNILELMYNICINLNLYCLISYIYCSDM